MLPLEPACTATCMRVPSADLTRVWCVYELAWWVHHKPKGKIVFVPLRANATLYGLLLNTMPLAISFLLVCVGTIAYIALFWSNLFQDNRQFQKCAARNRSPPTRCCHPVHAPRPQHDDDCVLCHPFPRVRDCRGVCLPDDRPRPRARGEIQGRGAATVVRRAQDQGIRPSRQAVGPGPDLSVVVRQGRRRPRRGRGARRVQPGAPAS